MVTGPVPNPDQRCSECVVGRGSGGDKEGLGGVRRGMNPDQRIVAYRQTRRVREPCLYALSNALRA